MDRSEETNKTTVFPYMQAAAAIIVLGMLLPMTAISYVEGMGWETIALPAILLWFTWPVIKAVKDGSILVVNQMVAGSEGNTLVGVCLVLFLAATVLCGMILL